jgi:hypothetical protein
MAREKFHKISRSHARTHAAAYRRPLLLLSTGLGKQPVRDERHRKHVPDSYVDATCHSLYSSPRLLPRTLFSHDAVNTLTLFNCTDVMKTTAAPPPHRACDLIFRFKKLPHSRATGQTPRRLFFFESSSLLLERETGKSLHSVGGAKLYKRKTSKTKKIK